MALKRPIAWSALATVLCATTVLAASGLVGLSLRPGFFDSAAPANPIPAVPTLAIEVAAPARMDGMAVPTDDARPAGVAEARVAAPVSALAGLWLRPALSEEDFNARFESASPALAFAARAFPAAVSAEDRPDVAAAEAGASAIASQLLTVRPPARPVFPRRRLASLDPQALVAVTPDPATESAVAPEAATAAAPGSFGSWSDPFNRNGSAPPAARTGRPLQAGVASWYGPGFHGRRTASGEVFNQNDMTAAHRYLPFGTRVRVVNEKTGQSVVVRINDRGPFSHGRVIDLSKASAQAVGMGGLARVKIVSADD